MTSHLWLMALFSVFVSVAFATLMRDKPRDQLLFGAKICAGFIGAGVIIGWLLYPLPL